MRLSANQPPLKSPCFFNASKAYWEQVGEYLQLGGNRGERKFWYPLMRSKNGKIKTFFKKEDL